MLISCEKCATTYVLDDRLIPAGGAPVQCTRCAHVFIAYPEAAGAKTTASPAAAPQPTPSQSHPVPPGMKPGGTPKVTAATPQAGGDRSSSTQIYGGAIPTDDEPPHESSGTQIFGRLPGTGASGQTAPYPRADFQKALEERQADTARTRPYSAEEFKRHIEQHRAQEDASPQQDRQNKTQLFAMSSLQPPAPAPAEKKFDPNATIPADVSAPVGLGSGRQTIIFGGGFPGAAAPAPAATPAPPAAEPRSTQMFGAVGTGSHAAPGRSDPRSTQMFGAVSSGSNLDPAPRQPPADPKATQIFGAGASGSHAAQGRSDPRSTQMFGAVGSGSNVDPAPRPAAADPKATQIFGASSTGSHAAQGRSDPRSTQMFGAVGTGSHAAPPGAPAAGKAGSATMIFGGASPGAAPAPMPNPRQTMIFGGGLPGAGAAADDKTPAGGLPAVSREPARATPAPAQSPDLAAMLDRDFDAKPDEHFDSPKTILSEDPLRDAMLRDLRASHANEAVTDPPPTRAGGLDLPPEEPRQRATGFFPEPAPAPSGEDPEVLVRKQIKRRNTLALVAIGAVLLLAAVAIAWKTIGKLLQSSAPKAAVEARDAAFAQLRFDDPEAQKQAVEQLKKLVSAYPNWPGSHAALVVATALEFDDARLELKHYQGLIDELQRKRNALVNDKSAPGWEDRANEYRDEIDHLNKVAEPLIDRAQKIDDELSADFKRLQLMAPEGEDPEVVRAQAIYAGVKGNDSALKLYERYRMALGGKDDGWAAMAYGEYAANSKTAPDTMNEARGQLDKLREADSTYLRPYVLSARLSFAQKQWDAGISALESAVALNPKHATARQLLQWGQDGQAEAKKAAQRKPTP